MPSLIEWSGCSPCPLRHEWPHLHTPKMLMSLPKETSPYRILACGEAPGFEEDNQGAPFVGKTGQYLRNYLPPKWKNKLYWQNTIRCRPPENRDPEPIEIQCCSTHLLNDIKSCNPQAVLAVGGYAANYFWKDDLKEDSGQGISYIRGVPFPSKKAGIPFWVYPIFHPSFVNRAERVNYDDGSTTNTALPLFKNDIKNFFKRVEEFSTPPTIYEVPKNIIYPKSPEEVLNLFNQLKEPYALDIETHKMKPYQRDARVLTAALSDGNLTFTFIVNWPGSLSSWGKQAFQSIITSPKRWIAQNSSFELKWVWYLTNWKTQQFEDTEILARLHHQRTGLGSLDVLSRIYLGIDIKKLNNLDKTNLIEYGPEKVLAYNALDAWAEYHVYQILLKKLDNIQLANYYRSIETVKSTVAMELKGLDVDLVESARLQKELWIKLDEIDQQAHQLDEVKRFEKNGQRNFKLSEPLTVAEVLVNYCGIKLEKSEANNYITNEEALEQFAGQHPLIDITLDFREHAKLKSTYVDKIVNGELLGTDGLAHPAYTVVHTATYRLSSYDFNVQNQPKRKNRHIRKQIVAPPGYMFAAFDYAQLEGRVIAMMSGDRALRKSFIEDEDIHWKWLYRIIDLYPAYMDRLARVSGETEEKKVLKAGRTIIKTDFVFASFYGSVVKSLVNRTGIPVYIMERVLGEFWDLYADVRRWTIGQSEYYQETGTVQSLTGRIRNEVLAGNEVTNSPSQGLAAELVLEAQNGLYTRAITEDMNFLPRINVHDDLVFALPSEKDSVFGDYIEKIASEIVKPRFNFVNVPLSTECRIGTNFCDLESVHTFSGDYYFVDRTRTEN